MATAFQTAVLAFQLDAFQTDADVTVPGGGAAFPFKDGLRGTALFSMPHEAPALGKSPVPQAETPVSKASRVVVQAALQQMPDAQRSRQAIRRLRAAEAPEAAILADPLAGARLQVDVLLVQIEQTVLRLHLEAEMLRQKQEEEEAIAILFMTMD